MEKDRRSLILDCAKELFATRGYHTTGISDIIEKAQVARGTFYLYFDSKRAVFDYLLDSAFETILSSVKPVIVGPVPDRDNILKQLRINLGRALAPLFADRHLARIVVSQAETLDEAGAARMEEFYAALRHYLEESLLEGQEKHVIRPLNTKIIATAAVGMIKGIVWTHATGSESFDYHEVVEEIVEWAAMGIVTR